MSDINTASNYYLAGYIYDYLRFVDFIGCHPQYFNDFGPCLLDYCEGHALEVSGQLLSNLADDEQDEDA